MCGTLACSGVSGFLKKKKKSSLPNPEEPLPAAIPKSEAEIGPRRETKGLQRSSPPQSCRSEVADRKFLRVTRFRSTLSGRDAGETWAARDGAIPRAEFGGWSWPKPAVAKREGLPRRVSSLSSCSTMCRRLVGTIGTPGPSPSVIDVVATTESRT